MVKGVESLLLPSLEGQAYAFINGHVRRDYLRKPSLAMLLGCILNGQWLNLSKADYPFR